MRRRLKYVFQCGMYFNGYFNKRPLEQYGFTVRVENNKMQMAALYSGEEVSAWCHLQMKMLRVTKCSEYWWSFIRQKQSYTYLLKNELMRAKWRHYISLRIKYFIILVWLLIQYHNNNIIIARRTSTYISIETFLLNSIRIMMYLKEFFYYFDLIIVIISCYKSRFLL